MKAVTKELPSSPQSKKGFPRLVTVIITICLLTIILVPVSFFIIIPWNNAGAAESWSILFEQDFWATIATTSNFTINTNEWKVGWLTYSMGTAQGYQDANSTLSVTIYDAFTDAVVETAQIVLSQSGYYSEHLFYSKGTFYIGFSLSGQHWTSTRVAEIQVSILH